MTRSIVFEAALRYAELGYAVFPCAPGDSKPLTANGFHDASVDPEQIERWWTAHPSANIGLPTAGLLVVDIDNATNPWPGPERALELATGAMARTPRGGSHHLFRRPAGKAWRCTQSELAPQVDTRTDGGYIVVPPSRRPDGEYRWIPGMELDVPPDRLPEPPAWLVDLFDRGSAGSAPGGVPSPTLAHVAAGGEGSNEIPSGQRNATLAKLAGTMRRVGMSQGEIQAALLRANADRCRPPLDPREVHRIAESVGRYEPDQISVALVENHWEQMLREKPGEFEFSTLTSRELDAGDFRQEFLVDDILVRGQPMIVAGPRKALKTNSCIDLALSLGQGGLFLGRFHVPKSVRVGMMSAESGGATLQETARRIARTKERGLADCEDAVVWSLQVPQLDNPVHIKALNKWVTRHELDVLILDPTYLMMLGIGQDAGNLFVVGRFLQPIADLVRETGVTPILCHHLRKGLSEPYEPAELEDIAWAGFQEFTRQWLLLNRRSRYNPDRPGRHELWLNVGGSAGHSGQYGLDIDEGCLQDVGGRRWDVELLSSSEAYARRSESAQEDRQRRQDRLAERRLRKHRETLQGVLRKHPAGETMTALRRESQLNPNNFAEVIAGLIEDGIAEPCDIAKGKRAFEGYRLASPDQGDQNRPNRWVG